MNVINEREERIFFYVACSCVYQNGTLFNFGNGENQFNYQWCIAFAENVSTTKLNQLLIMHCSMSGGGLFMDGIKSGSSKNIEQIKSIIYWDIPMDNASR